MTHPDAAPPVRLASQLLVTALVRRTQEAGGHAAILRKGDAVSGSMMIQTIHRGVETGAFERVGDGTGGMIVIPCGTQYWGDVQKMAQYIDRRVRSDPDLWLIELDIADGERFVAEFFGG